MVLCRCRCSNVVACHADDADTSTSVQMAPDFFVVVFTNLAPVSFSFSSVSMSLLRVLFLYRI